MAWRRLSKSIDPYSESPSTIRVPVAFLALGLGASAFGAASLAAGSPC